MRKTFITALTKRAIHDDSIVLLTGDLGYRVVEGFQEAKPNRYFNAGISEQNMIAVAAGLALEGRKVFVYSIAGFPTLRCLEQIRNCLCYPKLDVTIVCVGGGFAYGELGVTHHATEDIAVMRAMPNMEVLCPADPAEAEAVAKHCFETKGPKYVRINRGNEPDLPGSEGLKALKTVDFGGLVARMHWGADLPATDLDVAFLATGHIAGEVIEAGKQLSERGISSALFTVPRIKPLDEDGVLGLALRAKLVVTLEEHTVVGGLGSAVADLLEDARLLSRTMVLAPVLRVGIPDTFPDVVGSQAYLRNLLAMDASALVSRVEEALV